MHNEYTVYCKDGSVALWFVNVCLGATALQLDIMLCNKNGKMKKEYEICEGMQSGFFGGNFGHSQVI